MKKDDFKTLMAQQTDAELIRILSLPEALYQPEALLAAKAEFSNRNLSENAYTALKETDEASQQAAQDRATVPLEKHLKFLAFFFPGIIQLVFIDMFEANGYHRKAEELNKWTLFGTGFYILLAIVAIMIW
ncbi:MAG: hypothetical protein J7599_20475 [Niabella sp.]|nr:hypothetical protein [Niabella sp.]